MRKENLARFFKLWSLKVKHSKGLKKEKELQAKIEKLEKEQIKLENENSRMARQYVRLRDEMENHLGWLDDKSYNAEERGDKKRKKGLDGEFKEVDREFRKLDHYMEEY